MESNDGDCDSIILISFCYGKQVPVTEARGKEESASGDSFVGSAFSDEVMLNDVEQLKHLLPYDMGLSEKECAWHSPLMTFVQLKALRNMRIRSQQSEDRRRERWERKNEKYKENRDDSRVERRERKDSVPLLRRDTFKNVGEQRSRSVSRAKSRDPAARTPQPPPAPVRAPVTPPKTPPAPPTKIRYKAAPASSTNIHFKCHTAGQGTSAPPAPPARSARSPSNDPIVPSRTIGKSANTPPWRLQERGRQRSQTPDYRNTRKRTDSRSDWRERTRPYNIPDPPALPPRMTGSQWLDQGHQGTSSSCSGYRDYGYSYNQPSYKRANPSTNNVEYIPGYTVPRQRWIQKYDGSWLDMIPQTPDQSIFFHQSGELRRRNEMNFYGYTFLMGL